MNSRCRKHLEDTLKKKPFCHVMITCTKPSEDGEMDVEMTYDGDITLVSLLLQGAQDRIDDEESEQIPLEENSLSLRSVK